MKHEVARLSCHRDDAITHATHHGTPSTSMNVMMLAEVSAEHVIGGAERVLRGQALGLQERGHEVSLITRAPLHDRRVEVRVGGVVEQRYLVERWCEPAFVVSSLLRSVKAFDRISARSRPDVVLIHQALAGAGPLLWRRKRATGWVYVCHSLAHEEYLSRARAGKPAPQRLRQALNARLRLWLERLILGRCARVVALSEFMKRHVMEKHGLPESRLCVVPGASDPERFRPPQHPEEVRRQLKLPPDKFLLLTVRNLVPRMGLESLLEAMASLGEEGRDLLLLIGGEGMLRSSLEGLIRKFGLVEQVRLLGFIPEPLLPMYYQAADLVLMPTAELEGFGLVTVEAMACGTPVLGTPVGALPEVLGRVDQALVAEGTDPASLAKAIVRLVRRFRNRPGDRARLSERGLELVRQHYTWSRHCAQLETVLQTVCGSACGFRG